MSAESQRTTELRKIFDLPKTGKLPDYNDIEAFTSPLQQSRAMSVFPDSWQYHVRLAEGAMRNSFSRVIPRRAVTLDEARGIRLPEGAPVHDWRLDPTDRDQALTLIMKTEDCLVPGDVFCIEAIEAFMGSRGLSPVERRLTPLAVASQTPYLELAPN